MTFIEGILQAQRMPKCDLAFFYGLTPRAFRDQIANFTRTTAYSRYYTAEEVAKIFARLGYITEDDVTNAQTRIRNYHDNIRKKKKKAFLKSDF